MKNTVAILAHYDPENKFDETFKIVLGCLKHVCDSIVVVTTCRLQQSDLVLEHGIKIIRRPNIGYDFYSYRVGIETVRTEDKIEQVFLINSSFLVLDRKIFINTLEGMLNLLKKNQVVGCVESTQWGKHLQSYLLLFRKDVLESDWFQKWVDNIRPQNSKLETIIAGEFGLANAIKSNGVSSQAFFQLTLIEKIKACSQWMQYQAGCGFGTFVSALWNVTSFNPGHFAAKPLAERCGIVKAELLRHNPCNVSLSWYERMPSSSDRILATNFARKSREHYNASKQGLVVHSDSQTTPLPRFFLTTSGPLSRPGVRLAVVVHLFYPNLIGEIGRVLRHILEPFDLFVTTPHEGAVCAIFDCFGTLAETVAVSLTENRGRDVGPFIALHRQHYFERYEAVLKIHGKQSKYSKDGDFWRQRIFKELCGTSLIAQKSLDLIRSQGVGIIGPHEDYLTNERFWGTNKKAAIQLLEAAGILSPTSIKLGFFAGSMFWFKPLALASLHSIPESYLEFEPESGQQDGTLAHAIERIFSTVARDAGYSSMSIRSESKDMEELITKNNRVPVLPR